MPQAIATCARNFSMNIGWWAINDLCIMINSDLLYSASHSQVAPEIVGLQKEQKCNTFAFISVMKCGCVFWEFAKRKLATRKDKIKIINTKRDG
jgi:hypothetical protein